MRLLVENRDISDLLSDRIKSGKIVLFRYGPGTGGENLLKQFLSRSDDESHAVLISTHETEEELMDAVESMNLPVDLEMISMVPELNEGIKDVMKKDKFRSEGIMVTDILEVSSNVSYRRERRDRGQIILSRISALCQKQVLPFRMVLDSLIDLVYRTSEEEVLKRIWVLKNALREKGGMVILAAPLDWPFLKERETTLFDAVIEMDTVKTGGVWKRILLIKNVKGSGEPPEELEVSSLKEIPEAMSID
jgi:KaiC/GvpD/RAD55 family RecA-like ATPase